MSYAAVRFWKCSPIVFASVLATSIVAHAAGDANLCRSKQFGIVGKACSSMFKCYTDAAKASTTIGDNCIGTASNAAGTALDAVSAKNDCAVESYDAMDAVGEAAELAHDVAVDDLAYTTGGACAAAKLKATGKKCSSFLKCYSKGAKDGLAPAPECLAVASEKFTKAFTKAEDKFTCAPPASADTIEPLVDSFATSTSNVLTSTTTTTLPGSCAGLCGSEGPGSCFCDPPSCAAGDGCADRDTQCPGMCTTTTTTTTLPNPCGAGGVTVGSQCWYYGDLDQSCTSACLAHSRTYSAVTETYAGSSGTDEHCVEVLTALGQYIPPITNSSCTPNFGCGVQTLDPASTVRCTNGSSNPDGALWYVHRACACD